MSPGKKPNAGHSIFQQLLNYANYRLNAFQPEDALVAVRQIESSSRTLTRPLSQPASERLIFERGRALTELTSFQPALLLLDRVKTQPFLTEAKFLKAQILLSQKQVEESRTLLKEIVEGDESWRRANDALALLVALDPLVGESLDLFCQSVLYQLQGRAEDAVPVLRQLAVEQFDKDPAEWARYQIGRLKEEAGDAEGARKEWDQLLLEANHPVILGMLRRNRIHRINAAGERITDMTAYQELLLDFPDTLASDLARLEVQQDMMRIRP